MAALFYQMAPISDGFSPYFKNGFAINSSIHLPLLSNHINKNDAIIYTEVTLQNRDTIQYFLTFNDFITFFYFGKGLGTMTVNGLILGQYHGYFQPNSFDGARRLMDTIGNKFRGQKNTINFGGYTFYVVLSSYTFRTCTEDMLSNVIEFNLQFEIVDHHLPRPVFTSGC